MHFKNESFINLSRFRKNSQLTEKCHRIVRQLVQRRHPTVEIVGCVFDLESSREPHARFFRLIASWFLVCVDEMRYSAQPNYAIVEHNLVVQSTSTQRTSQPCLVNSSSSRFSESVAECPAVLCLKAASLNTNRVFCLSDTALLAVNIFLKHLFYAICFDM